MDLVEWFAVATEWVVEQPIASSDVNQYAILPDFDNPFIWEVRHAVVAWL